MAQWWHHQGIFSGQTCGRLHLLWVVVVEVDYSDQCCLCIVKVAVGRSKLWKVLVDWHWMWTPFFEYFISICMSPNLIGWLTKCVTNLVIDYNIITILKWNYLEFDKYSDLSCFEFGLSERVRLGKQWRSFWSERIELGSLLWGSFIWLPSSLYWKQAYT